MDEFHFSLRDETMRSSSEFDLTTFQIVELLTVVEFYICMIFNVFESFYTHSITMCFYYIELEFNNKQWISSGGADCVGGCGCCGGCGRGGGAGPQAGAPAAGPPAHRERRPAREQGTGASAPGAPPSQRAAHQGPARQHQEVSGTDTFGYMLCLTFCTSGKLKNTPGDWSFF